MRRSCEDLGVLLQYVLDDLAGLHGGGHVLGAALLPHERRAEDDGDVVRLHAVTAAVLRHSAQHHPHMVHIKCKTCDCLSFVEHKRTVYPYAYTCMTE